MYSVSIVWSAFAFIHLRLVHPRPFTRTVTLPLVLLNVPPSSKTLQQSTVAPDFVAPSPHVLPPLVIAH